MTSTEEVKAKQAEYNKAYRCRRGPEFKAERAAYMREWRKRWTPEFREKELQRGRYRGQTYQKTPGGKLVGQRAAKRFRDKLRHEVLVAYGGKCVCCGENEYEFLTLDHIVPIRARTGSKERSSSYVLCLEVRRQNYPKDFQVLCYNCNCAKRTEGECPHRRLAMTKFTLLRLLSGGEANRVSNSSGGVK